MIAKVLKLKKQEELEEKQLPRKKFNERSAL